MIGDVLWIVTGLAALAIGGDALVRGAVALARHFRVTPAVIGLTVVAAGTSMPELVVSVVAALQGSPDLAVANVVGSNIFNIGLVLGLTGIVIVLPVARMTLRAEWPFLLVVTLIVVGLMKDATLGRIEGVFFLAALTVFVVVMVRVARREAAAAPGDLPAADGVLRGTVYLLLGFALLVAGGKFVVDGATGIALRAGLSERVIGLTIVAMGTSLPELASSLVAALRGRSDVAVGNIVGSCIFNLLGILGAGAVLVPLTVSRDLYRADVWWMLGFTVLMAPLVYSDRKLGRPDGIVLATAFTAYIGFVLFG